MRLLITSFLCLSFLHGAVFFLSQKSLELLIPKKVFPSLIQDALLTNHFISYFILCFSGHIIILIFASIIACWMAKTILILKPHINSILAILLSVFLTFSLISALNSILFPHSLAALPTLNSWLLLILSGSIIASFVIYHSIIRKKTSEFLKIMLFLLLVTVLTFPHFTYTPHSFNKSHNNLNTNDGNEKAPHIILIGIDSLRPDFTTLFENNETTPHVNKFLKKAISFPETYTPIARTFPAWVSILTGKYPWNAGVDFNLTAPDPKALAQALPHDFKKAGYTTFFATDEKRFSNIDESFGLDNVAGPIMGAADFLLGKLNDTVLSNLFINGLFGRFFFPFSHANRPAHVTYDPETFVRHLNAKLPNNPESPAFIAIHLCLAHHPFIWKNAPLKPHAPNDRTTEYTLSLQAADQQFGNIIKMLKRKKLLDNAWVILLSDHGEGLGEPLLQPYGKSNNQYVRQGDVDWGHGTSVLSPRQYRVMLAFRRYGQDSYEAGSRIQPAMLTDILPTLMDDLKINPKEKKLDGISLLTALKNDHIRRDRILFFETGLNPKEIPLDGVKIGNAEIYAGMSLYTINNQNGRLLLKSEVIEREKKYKEYGMVQNGHFLALMSPDRQGFRKWIYKQENSINFEIHDSPATLPHDAKIILHQASNTCQGTRLFTKLGDGSFYDSAF